MLSALAFTLHLLLGAEGKCYFVSNTRILVLPSCDIGPATIAELTERSAPWSGAGARRPGAPSAIRTAALSGSALLERRLERAEQERVDAVADRLAAERLRDLALGRQAEALRALEEARRALAAAEARLARAERCDPRSGRAE